MKYVKFLGLAALAMASMMAIASSAMATYATSPANVTYTGRIVGHVEKHALLTGPFGTFGSITCAKSTVEGKIETHGTAETHTLEGKITSLTFEECTGGKPTTPVASPGKIVVHTTTAAVTNSDGTVTSSGATVVVHETAVGKCTFVTNNTDIGWLTGSTTTKTNATLDIKGSIPNDGSNPFCGSNSTWEGSYTITAPDSTTPNFLDIH